ncbi:MAG: Gfo/Idh/MocA family oxidoreductase [Terrimicrobiaceae bacterium]|nr:Gfo/Idh/MocA family oxidoreductase [Terrimicrobiaceae bacterium]
MSGANLSVGIIGCGNISEIYAQAGRRFEDIEIAACADLDPERAKALAKKHGIPRVLEVEELLCDPAIGVVLNLTVPAAHATVALAAVKRGKHVYGEKPLAIKRRAAREFLGLAREKKLRIGCAPDTFLGAGYQTARKLLDDGAIGEPVGATAFMLSRGPESWHPNPDFFYKKGAGPLFDIGPYYLTVLTALLGPVRRVSGSTRISFPERVVGSGPLAGKKISVETPTHVAGVLEFDAGAIGTICTSFDVVAHRHPPVEIYGTEGTLVLPDPNTFGGPIHLRRLGDSDWTEIPLTFGYADNSRGVGLADMISAIRTGREHRANGRIAYHVLDLMHSILDAGEAGQYVELASSMNRPAPLPEGLTDGKVTI